MPWNGEGNMAPIPIKEQFMDDIKYQLKLGLMTKDFIYDSYFINHTTGSAISIRKGWPNLIIDEFMELITYGNDHR